MLFTFPSRYSALSVAEEYFALGGGPPSFPRDFTWPVVLGILPRPPERFRLQGSYLLWPAFSDRSASVQALSARMAVLAWKSHNPAVKTAAAYHVTAVWAVPRSLAATEGIDISSSSSGYLDVSVPPVSPRMPMYSACGDTASPCRVSPFGHPRIKACLRLPEAFRSLPRPSSALSA